MISPTALGRRFLRARSSTPEIGFHLSIEGAKALFFDRESVLQAANKAELRALSRFGYFTMRDARQSLRKRKRASQEGQPPTNQTGLLKRFIFFSYDAARHSVVIGPTMIEGYMRFLRIPRVLEEGGVTRLTYQTRLTGVGDTGRHRGHFSASVVSSELRIRPRPYMRPAFDRQKAQQMPHLWRNAIRAASTLDPRTWSPP